MPRGAQRARSMDLVLGTQEPPWGVQARVGEGDAGQPGAGRFSRAKRVTGQATQGLLSAAMPTKRPPCSARENRRINGMLSLVHLALPMPWFCVCRFNGEMKTSAEKPCLNLNTHRNFP